MSDQTRVTLTGRIMVSTIIALFFVVIIILCIHILTRVFLWRRSSRGSYRRRRFVFVEGEMVAQGLRRGVDPIVMKYLPVVVFSGMEFNEGLECAVCLGEVAEGEKVRILPNCSHGFHVGCIDMWIQSHSTCPLCRSPVDPRASVPRNSTSMTRSGEGASGRLDETLVIDIPRNNLCNDMSSSGMTLNDQDESRSPLSSRLRSLTRLWSMNHQVTPSSSNTDVEQGNCRI